MSTTTAATQATYMTLDMEQTDRLIHALQSAKRAARRDAQNYADEGVTARVMITAETTAGHSRLLVETMESWITAFGIDDIDGE
jgi:hypothetical protein